MSTKIFIYGPDRERDKTYFFLILMMHDYHTHTSFIILVFTTNAKKLLLFVEPFRWTGAKYIKYFMYKILQDIKYIVFRKTFQHVLMITKFRISLEKGSMYSSVPRCRYESYTMPCDAEMKDSRRNNTALSFNKKTAHARFWFEL